MELGFKLCVDRAEGRVVRAAGSPKMRIENAQFLQDAAKHMHVWRLIRGMILVLRVYDRSVINCRSREEIAGSTRAVSPVLDFRFLHSTIRDHRTFRWLFPFSSPNGMSASSPGRQSFLSPLSQRLRPNNSAACNPDATKENNLQGPLSQERAR